ncbi:MAG: nucleotidyltransferase domain-containing protein [Kineosporiaceae bacterium]
MEISRPMRIVTAALDGDLLAVLARADHGFTGRQLARLAGASSEGARQALARLVVQGIVQREPVGAAQMYRLNREHLAAPAVLALADLRSTLLNRLRDALSAWDPAADHAALFGSAARGEQRADSDLDICIVRPDAVSADDPTWRTQIARLEHDVTRWTGNDARVLELASTDDLSTDTESVVDDILREGIPLSGEATALRRLRTSPRPPSHCRR